MDDWVNKMSRRIEAEFEAGRIRPAIESVLGPIEMVCTFKIKVCFELHDH